MGRKGAGCRLLVWAWVPLLAACQPGSDDSLSSGSGEPRALVDAGRFDEALARLKGARGPEAQLLTGLALAGKARAAGPPSSGVLTPEATQALAVLDQVKLPAASHAEAQLARAELLAPFALAAAAATEAGAAPMPTPEPSEDGQAAPDLEPPVDAASVVDAYRVAVDHDTTRDRALDALVAFCHAAGCLEATDAAYRSLVERSPQDRELPARYAAFLVEKGDRARALEQYAIALIWRPDDAGLRARVADIHLAQAFDHLEWGEYPQAEKALQESRAYIGSKESPQWARLQEGLERLDRIRPRRR